MPAFRRLMEEHDVLRRDASISDEDVAGYFGHFYELVMHDREFTVEPEYSSETVRMYFDPNGPYAHVARAANIPPAFVITQRINLGLIAVLGRLRATREAVVPVGITCRACERMDCEQRAFPALQHRLSINEHVRGVSFYVPVDDA